MAKKQGIFSAIRSIFATAERATYAVSNLAGVADEASRNWLDSIIRESEADEAERLLKEDEVYATKRQEYITSALERAQQLWAASHPEDAWPTKDREAVAHAAAAKFDQVVTTQRQRTEERLKAAHSWR